MAFGKKMLPATLALLLMSFTSYGAWGRTSVSELEDDEICHLAKYTLEKSIKTIDTDYTKFKNTQLENRKNKRNTRKVEVNLRRIESAINDKKSRFNDWLMGVNRCIDGDSSECSHWANTCRQEHAVSRSAGMGGFSPLLVIEKASFDLNTGRVLYQDSPKIADIEIVMETFEAAEKEKQLAEEKRAREKEARKIARERQQAEKDFLAAQKNLEEQKILDAKNEKLRAEAEELNRLRAQAQAEKAELEKLEAARAELAALKQELEAAKIKAAVEAKNREKAEELNRLKTQAMAEQAELERLEAQKAELSLLKQQSEASQIMAKVEAENKAESDALLKQKENLISIEKQKQAKARAEQEQKELIDGAFLVLETYAAEVATVHNQFKQQLELGTPDQKRQATKVLSYTSKALGLLNETLDICNKGKATGNMSECSAACQEKVTKAEYIMLELEQKIDTF